MWSVHNQPLQQHSRDLFLYDFLQESILLPRASAPNKAKDDACGKLGTCFASANRYNSTQEK